jgi:hypothetical protein
MSRQRFEPWIVNVEPIWRSTINLGPFSTLETGYSNRNFDPSVCTHENCRKDFREVRFQGATQFVDPFEF